MATFGARSRLVAAAVALSISVVVANAFVVGKAMAAEDFDFTLPQQQGGNWRLSEHRGEVVWVVIVAPWCGGCSDFVDRVQSRATRVGAVSAARATVAGSSPPTTDAQARPPNVVAISAIDRAHDSGALLANHNVPVLIDRRGEVLAQLAPANLPWMFLINEDGHVDASGADVDALTRTRDTSPSLVKQLRRWWQR